MNYKVKPITVAVGAVMTACLAGAAFADTEEDPFALEAAGDGYDLLAGEHSEGECGEGKCGEGKCGEGKCGDDGGDDSGDEGGDEGGDDGGDEEAAEEAPAEE